MSLRELAMGLCLATVGCGPSSVEGSLSVLLNLDYQKVTVEASSSEVGVSFVQPRSGGGEDTSLRVTAKLDGATLFPNIAFNLAENISDGSQRGTVSRDVQNDPHRSFPPIKIGTLHLLDVPGKTGSRVRGDFNLIFDNCTDYACGYTAFANFTGQVP